jgi:hypothetical protein
LKKFALILFSIYYLLPAVGFSIDLHWCGNQVSAVTFSSGSEQTCGCAKKMAAGCCKSSHISIKLQDNHKTEIQLSAPKNNSVKDIQVATLPVSSLTSSQVLVFDISGYHSPPPKSKQPVYLANNVFRI